MKIAVRVERNVSEQAIIEVKDLDELKQLIEENKLFEEIDRQHAEKGESEVWEETYGDVLFTRVAELDENNNNVQEYDIDDETGKLIPLNEYGEREDIPNNESDSESD